MGVGMGMGEGRGMGIGRDEGLRNKKYEMVGA